MTHLIPNILWLYLICLMVSTAHAIIANPSGCVEKKHPPKGIVCGRRVDLDSSTATQPLVVKSIEVCRDLLWARHQTDEQYFLNNFFLFNLKNHSCELYSLSRSDHFKENKNSKTVLYDVLCFNCPPQCPQEVGLDLVGNGGFEASDELVGPWRSNPQQSVISPGNYSRNALSLYCGDAPYGCTGPSQDINTCPDTAYYFEFNYIYVITKGQGKRDFTYNTNDGWQASERTTPRNVWLLEGHTIMPHISFLEIVGFFGTSRGRRGDHFDLDNVKLVALPETFPIAAGATPVISNGGFESGDIHPWRYRTDATFFNVSVVSPGINSAHALYYHVKRTGNFIYYPLTLIQTVITSPSTQYVISLNMQYLSNATKTYEGSFTLGKYNSDSPYPLFYKNSALQAIFTAPTNLTQLRITLIYNGEDPLLIDNIVVAEFAGIRSFRPQAV